MNQRAILKRLEARCRDLLKSLSETKGRCDDPIQLQMQIDLCCEFGDVYIEEGRYGDLDELLETVADMKEVKRIGYYPKEAWIDKMKGIRFLMEQRYVDSEHAYKNALKSLDVDCRARSHVLINLGILCHYQYRYEDAEKYIDKAFENLGIHEKDCAGDAAFLKDKAEAYDYRGVLRRIQAKNDNDTEKYDLALKDFDESLKLLSELGDNNGIAMVVQNKALLCQDKEDYTTAEKLFQRAIHVAAAIEAYPMLANCLANLGIMYVAKGDSKKAEKTFSEAAPIFDSVGHPRKACQMYIARAEMYKKQGKIAQAMKDLDRVVKLTLKCRAHLSGSDQDRAKTFSQFYGRFETAIEWQYEWQNNSRLSEMKAAGNAYTFMEQSRAQGLLDALDANGIDLFEGMTDEEKKELKQEEEDSFNEMQRLIRHSYGLESNPFNSVEMVNAIRRFNEARTNIQNRSPLLRKIIDENREPIPFKDIQKTFKQDRTLALEYFFGPTSVYLLAYGDIDKPRLVKLENHPPNSENSSTYLRERLHDMFTLMAEMSRPKPRFDEYHDLNNRLNRLLNELWEYLLPDPSLRDKVVAIQTATDMSETKRLLILPDGPLVRLPFEALIVNREKPVKYLLDYERVTVYSPSAYMHEKLKARKNEPKDREPEKKTALTVGGVDYSNHQRTTALTLRTIEASKSESDGVEKIWGDDDSGHTVHKFQGDKATKAEILAVLPHSQRSHIASHGFCDDVHGNLLGFLAFAVGDTEKDSNDNGRLTLAEIFRLKLSFCEIAILSACDTNLGEIVHGEVAWSIGRGFLVAGSNRVVVSNWMVDDNATAQLIVNFVKGTNRHDSDFAVALWEAKRHLRSEGAPPHRAPYFWSPFILIGTY